ncbi:hypothetical protein, unlikely [Trypanosoma brucei gambiense DAL972]|uniref:Uncharacterized protein n=1 Tax=Trypanosoma brucei gambiense (strain MHOM/CI/86/DAL972) TaxID=679716 RepID=C9ZVF5_TRYB9|nr:hypothetical protein, unlikely [Trypanosoma brucei gambiense DAL972]CBH13393.1 hypothetical protein, unlikely [Trypanosoma brucei gambiense DAL972]|eukprot:XP_011775670.1 hypothetical protein, unlikely [Trypanosoma brucei gambiense DAL972]
MCLRSCTFVCVTLTSNRTRAKMKGWGWKHGNEATVPLLTEEKNKNGNTYEFTSLCELLHPFPFSLSSGFRPHNSSASVPNHTSWLDPRQRQNNDKISVFFPPSPLASLTQLPFLPSMNTCPAPVPSLCFSTVHSIT